MTTGHVLQNSSRSFQIRINRSCCGHNRIGWPRGRDVDGEACPSHPQRSGERLEAFAAAVARDRPETDVVQFRVWGLGVRDLSGGCGITVVRPPLPLVS